MTHHSSFLLVTMNIIREQEDRMHVLGLALQVMQTTLRLLLCAHLTIPCPKTYKRMLVLGLSSHCVHESSNLCQQGNAAGTGSDAHTSASFSIASAAHALQRMRRYTSMKARRINTCAQRSTARALHTASSDMQCALSQLKSNSVCGCADSAHNVHEAHYCIHNFEEQGYSSYVHH
jgi:hypothetical protein